MSIDSSRKSGPSYHKFSDKPVEYSCEVRDGVIADFDASGSLRGIEVTDPSVLSKTPLESLVHEANKASRGSKGKPQIKIPEL